MLNCGALRREDRTVVVVGLCRIWNRLTERRGSREALEPNEAEEVAATAFGALGQPWWESDVRLIVLSYADWDRVRRELPYAVRLGWYLGWVRSGPHQHVIGPAGTRKIVLADAPPPGGIPEERLRVLWMRIPPTGPTHG